MQLRALLPALAVAILAPQHIAAQTPSTARDIRRADSTTAPAMGDRVRIAGRVVVGSGVLSDDQVNIYVQDSTGAVLVDADRPRQRVTFVDGDSVVAWGTIDDDRSEMVLDDATVVAIAAERSIVQPVVLDSLVPRRVAALQSRLVTVDAHVVGVDFGSDHAITIGHPRTDGNYIIVRDEGEGSADARLDRFAIGDRIRVTGVLVRRLSQRTGISRYVLYPRRAADVAAVGLTAAQRRNAATGAALLLLGVALGWGFLRRRRARHAVVQALRRDASRFESLLEDAPVGIVVHRDRRILYMNRAFRMCAGVAEGAEGAAGAERHFDALVTRDASSPDGATVVCASGTVRHVEITDAPATYMGEPCTQSFILDVTEHVEAQRALRESEALLLQSQKLEAIGQLAAGVAHDFNNLLTIIRGNADLLRDGCGACGAASEESLEIVSASDRAAALTRQLLAFSRKQVISPQLLELDESVRSLEGMLRRLLPENVHLHVIPEASGCAMLADPVQVEQVIMNLSVNARDAMPHGGVLTIRTSNVSIDGRDELARRHGVSPGPYLRLSVTDTGIGMDEETQRHVFEPFFTTKGVGQGTGLGLATVYGIMQQCGGHAVVSSRPGAGTTFTLYFPRASGAAQHAVTQEHAIEPAPSGSRGTILLVEDEASIRRLLERTLSSAGFTLLVAEDGTRAIEHAREHAGPIDLLLTDVVMPGLSGTELAAHLRRVRHGLPVLYMSGYTDEHTIRHGVASDDLLPKPFTHHQLLLRVHKVMRDRAGAAA